MPEKIVLSYNMTTFSKHFFLAEIKTDLISIYQCEIYLEIILCFNFE